MVRFLLYHPVVAHVFAVLTMLLIKKLNERVCLFFSSTLQSSPQWQTVFHTIHQADGFENHLIKSTWTSRREPASLLNCGQLVQLVLKRHWRTGGFKAGNPTMALYVSFQKSHQILLEWEFH